MKRMFLLHVKTVRVIEPAVPSFRDYWQRPPITACVGGSVRDAPLDHCVADDTDAVRVGDQNGPFEETGFFEPSRARHFAVAVERPPASEDGIVHGVFSAGKNGSDAGADGTFTDLKLAFARDERCVTDGDTGDVGNRVERARRAAEGNAYVSRSRFRFC